jgi:hypothetical protein
MVEIKITEDEARNEYLLEPKSTFLGARYDKRSDEIKVIFPQREIDNESSCVMIITNSEKVIDCVTVRNDEVFNLNSPASLYKQVFIGFSFQKPDGYIKNSDIGVYFFRDAQAPDAIVPITPIQREKINLLLSDGFAGVDWAEDGTPFLEFKNVDGKVVKRIYVTGDGGSGAPIDLTAYQKKIDENLETDSKEIVGAINEIKAKVEQGGGGVDEETDPTVPLWAKEPNKPEYAYEEIKDRPTLGALAEKDSLAYEEITGKPDLVEIGETAGKAYDGASGKKNADDIAVLKEQIAPLEEAIKDNADAIAELTKTKASTEYVDDTFIKNPKPQSNSVLLLDGGGEGKTNVGTFTNSYPYQGAFYRCAGENEGDTMQGSGYFLMNDPKKPYQGANKKYVDDEISKVNVGGGGLTESEVQEIAEEKATEALDSAKEYTDEKIGDIETVLTAILGV